MIPGRYGNGWEWLLMGAYFTSHEIVHVIQGHHISRQNFSEAINSTGHSSDLRLLTEDDFHLYLLIVYFLY